MGPREMEAVMNDDHPPLLWLDFTQYYEIARVIMSKLQLALREELPRVRVKGLEPVVGAGTLRERELFRFECRLGDLILATVGMQDPDRPPRLSIELVASGETTARELWAVAQSPVAEHLGELQIFRFKLASARPDLWLQHKEPLFRRVPHHPQWDEAPQLVEDMAKTMVRNLPPNYLS